MNKIFTSLILLGLLVMMPATVVVAQEGVTPLPTSSISTIPALIELLNKLVNYLYTFLLILAAAYLVWGGLDFIVSAGDETKVKSSRNKITYALIGVAVAVVSKGLMTIVINIVK